MKTERKPGPSPTALKNEYDQHQTVLLQRSYLVSEQNLCIF